MLDTNIASDIIKGPTKSLKARLTRSALGDIAISAITEAELLRGVARKPDATRLSLAVREFLLRVDILPWDSQAAAAYAHLRTAIERDGKALGTMDMLIAAHSVAVDAVLVSRDKAFFQLKRHLKLADWSKRAK